MVSEWRLIWEYYQIGKLIKEYVWKSDRRFEKFELSPFAVNSIFENFEITKNRGKLL